MPMGFLSGLFGGGGTSGASSSGGLFSSSKQQTSQNQTWSLQDSGNIALNRTLALDNVGNVAVNLPSPSAGGAGGFRPDALLLVAGLALLATAAFAGGGKR